LSSRFSSSIICLAAITVLPRNAKREMRRLRGLRLKNGEVH
jgi:hypothetical protein